MNAKLQMVTAAALAAAFTVGGAARAESLPIQYEVLSTGYGTPPNVIFLLDLSTGMDADCGGVRCIDRAVNNIRDTVSRYDWAWFGVVGTAADGSTNTYREIVPLGLGRQEVLNRLSTFTPTLSSTRNLGEALAGLSSRYISNVPSSTAASRRTFLDAPVCAECQETHVITITSGLPTNDDQPVLNSDDLSLSQVRCLAGGTPATLLQADQACRYDDVVRKLFNTDHRADLDGVQRIITHTVSVGVDTVNNPTAVALYESAEAMTDYWGGYVAATRAEGPRSGLMEVMEMVRWAFGGRAAPELDIDDEWLIRSYYYYGYYGPLGLGYLRGYLHEGDPTAPVSNPWEAGWNLYNRTVTASENNEDDRNGLGRRDIYTYLPELIPTGTTRGEQGRLQGRMGFDRKLVEALISNSSVMSRLIEVGANGLDHPHNMNRNSVIGSVDMQMLVDFTRGVSSTPFRYGRYTRGAWRLADSPGSTPVIVRQRDGYGVEPSFRNFQKLRVAANVPEVVLVAANDGMLHAFELNTGNELWAWIPAFLLYRNAGTPWAAHFSDLAVVGRTEMLEGTPVVEDVWIDRNGNGIKDCWSSLSTCEWRKVVVVSQGRGGSGVLALDITDSRSPVWMWEHLNVIDRTAAAWTVSEPVVANLQVVENNVSRDLWTSFWGSGWPVNGDLYGASVRGANEPALMFRALEDDAAADRRTRWEDQVLTSALDVRGAAHHPLEDQGLGSTVDLDGDLRSEAGSAATPPAVLDVDGDGDVDVAYMVMGSTATNDRRNVLYKAIFDPQDPDDPTWCEVYDPFTTIGSGPPVYHGLTLAWFDDGSLGIYWGSGSPYDDITRAKGAFYGIRDPDPMGCATPDPICGSAGLRQLDTREGVSGRPVVYNGAVWFTTWTHDTASCGQGTGRLYALDYQTCQPVRADGAAYVNLSGYASSLRVTAAGPLVATTADWFPVRPPGFPGDAFDGVNMMGKGGY